MPDTPEGRVTLAIIQRDILHLTGLLEAHIESDKARDERIDKLDARLTLVEPTVRTMARVLEIALYIVVVAAIGGVIWAAIQSGAALP